MKRIKRTLTAVMAFVMALALSVPAFAATADTATVDTTRTASLTVYKYDKTRLETEYEWDFTTPATGLYDEDIVGALSSEELPNFRSENNLAYSYAIRGVEFTYVKLASFYTPIYNPDGWTQDLYQFDLGAETAELILEFTDLLGVTGQATIESAYTSDMLIDALNTKLSTKHLQTKNTLEVLARNYGTAMPLTDEHGRSQVTGLPLGLYLVVETRVPDYVTATVDPFLVSLPMTTVDGTDWNYDVTVYPKNETGLATLDKTVREAAADTGNNNGSALINDGYAHAVSASAGDKLEYQIISHIPTITSTANYLTTYTFEDTLSAGLTFTEDPVSVEVFSDAACTQKLTNWTGNSNHYYTTSFSEDGKTMTVNITSNSLTAMNTSRTYHHEDSDPETGYSGCYMRLTYSAVLNSNSTFTLGDTPNNNAAQLTWKRTNTAHFDVLQSDTHVYTYGIDLTKQFSDNQGDYSNVQFNIYNETDEYYLTGTLISGVYYVTGHVEDAEDATAFVPWNGHLIIKGMENDTYTVTEIQTDAGYTLLDHAITLSIAQEQSYSNCGICWVDDITATATVNDETVSMTQGHAIVPFTVINTRGFTLPQTGSYGMWMFTLGGVLLLGAGAWLVLSRKRESDEDAEEE